MTRQQTEDMSDMVDSPNRSRAKFKASYDRMEEEKPQERKKAEATNSSDVKETKEGTKPPLSTTDPKKAAVAFLANISLTGQQTTNNPKQPKQAVTQSTQEVTRTKRKPLTSSTAGAPIGFDLIFIFF